MIMILAHNAYILQRVVNRRGRGRDSARCSGSGGGSGGGGGGGSGSYSDIDGLEG